MYVSTGLSLSNAEPLPVIGVSSSPERYTSPAIGASSTGLTVTLRAMGIHYVVLSAGDAVLAEGEVPDGEAATFRIRFKGEVPSEIRVDGYWDDVEFQDGLPPLAAPRIGLVDPKTPGRGIRRWVVNRDTPA